MKKLIIIAVLAATSAAVPAYAISEAYRQQLQHEHKTMVSDANAPVHVTKITPVHVNKLGVDFKRGADGIAYINGKAAANDESSAEAQTYSAGLISVIVYKNGKINAMKEGKYLGRLK
ncbi:MULTISPECIES: hypothetical protein [Citrobacter]|jgi:hypothetical protein|uniref:Uncharacterized protein n=1 Tax=Citrobacter europaeus TaxID=1914243 RepID=A0ABY0JXP6_9ENTR|nr:MULTISPECIES: hypothetical protein [Citrobacter]KDF18537.1 hypothetical protein AF42_01866 [Citrobacter freundii MGH 56]APR33131.1 hypothetical protein BTW28_20260 [Citrobacter freundii]AUT97444.1 hypothetical protein MC47_020015 [Citrobacter freundii]MDM3270985.1 hypothetical protein [Citrobacter sp. Ce129]MDM3282225.1 hypothetical protein [Citrobacter sp. Ce104]